MSAALRLNGLRLIAITGLVSLWGVGPARAQTSPALCPGDIALVGWIKNGSPDSFAFVTLKQIDPNTVIYFTDNGWITGSNSFRTGEGVRSWRANTTISAGRVLTSSATSPDFTWTNVTGSLDFAGAGDQLYAFQASNASSPLTTVAVHLSLLDDTNLFEDATSSNHGNVPPGLSTFFTAITFNQAGSSFIGFNTGSLASGNHAEWLQQIANGGNWTFSGSGTLPSGTITVNAASPSITRSDTSYNAVTVNGTLGTNEYGPANAYSYTGGGNGFGGTVGAGTLYMNSDSTNLYVAFQPGASVNDAVVIYLDPAGCQSGQVDRSMTDTTTGDRSAISNLTQNADDRFPIRPDYALTIFNSGTGAFLYQLNANANHTFLTNANVQPSGAGNSSVLREMSIPLSTLGLTAGGTLDFFAAYCGTLQFNSNESIPASPALNGAGNPGTAGPSAGYANFGRFIVESPCTAPSIATQPGHQTVCENSSASFTVGATGTTPFTYQWRRGTSDLINGGNISGADTATLTINPVALGDAATDYNVVVTNACGSATSNGVTLTVNPLPTPPASAAVDTPSYCDNAAPATISLSATGGSGTTLEWFSGSCGGTAVGMGSPLVIAAPGVTTTYYARWTNSCGSSTCASVTVSVNTATAATAANGGPYCVGDTIQFSGGPNGMSSYSWSGPNGYSSNAQSPTIASAQLTDSGTYTLTITDANGCSESASTSVTVQNCVSTGACCLPSGACDASGDQAYCTGLGGVYHGTGSLCSSPVVCPQPTNNLPQCCFDSPAIDGTLDPSDGWMLVSEAGFTNPIRGGQTGSSDFIGESSATLLYDASGPTTTDIAADSPSNTADIHNLYVTWDANNLYIAVSGPTGHFTAGATDRLDLFVAIDTGNSPTSTRTPTKLRFNGGGLMSKNIDFAGWSPDFYVAIENVESGAGYGQLANAVGTVLASDNASNVANAGNFELGGSRGAALTEMRIAWSALGGAPPTLTGAVWNFAVYTTGDGDDFDAYDTAPGFGQGVSQYPNFEQLGDVPNDGDWCGTTSDPVTGATDPSCPDAESDDTVGTGNGVLADPSSDNINDGDIDTISGYMQVRNVGARDAIAPTFSVPASRTVAGNNPVYADAGACVATLSADEIGTPTALNDNCVPIGNLVTSWVRSDSAPNLADPFDPGTTTITWTVGDGCNQALQNQLIEVLPENLLVIDVALRGMPAGVVERCIAFELLDQACAPQAWSETLSFTNGVVNDLGYTVPCGAYKCLTAQDPLHTLTRRLDHPGSFSIVAKRWDASFTATAADLVGGDFYDDNMIDIVDFGTFIAAWGWMGPGDTDCATPWPHADISGDGAIGAGDFAFISTNFFTVGQSSCACTRARLSSRGQPRQSITVEALRAIGATRESEADLNFDGWVDLQDVELYFRGARPGMKPENSSGMR